MQIKSAKDLVVYQTAYLQAMEIFHLRKSFPCDERYSLIDQIRRSSRAVCSNLKEAWAKRRYQAHFISKLTDADGENAETETWLDFAYDCNYVEESVYQELIQRCHLIGGMLGKMMNNPTPFIQKAKP